MLIWRQYEMKVAIKKMIYSEKLISNGELERGLWNIWIIGIGLLGKFFQSLLWLVLNCCHRIWWDIWWTRTSWFWYSKNFWFDTNIFSYRIHDSFRFLIRKGLKPYRKIAISSPKFRSMTEALIKWFMLLDKIETKDVKNESPKIIQMLTKMR